MTAKAAARCPHCHKLTTDEWVRRLNGLAATMDETCYATHPSAWKELLTNETEQFTQTVNEPTCECQQPAA